MYKDLILVAAALGLLIASVVFERKETHSRYFSWAFMLLALLCVGSFFNFGAFRSRGQQFHKHEQFHFFLGSKYLEEIRYDAIYDAVTLAVLDDRGARSREIPRRDPMTFVTTDLPIPPEREAEVRRRFAPQRWEAFRHDVKFFIRRLPNPMLTDHGNTGSPSWALLAGLFTRNVTLAPRSASLLANLDPLLLLILFVTVGWAFGMRTAALTMIVGLTMPLVYAYLGGSILRMDWLVALGLSVCFFEKRHFGTAGLFLGYAVSSKLLAGVMVLPLALHFLAGAIHERRVNRDHLRFVVFAAVGLALFVFLSSLFFSGIAIWREYADRLLATFQEQYYRRQHSLRDLFLQAYYIPGSIWHPFPRFIAAANPMIFIDQVRGAFIAAQAVLLAGLALLAARRSTRFAFALGPLAVFVLLVTNRYYWQMWLIAAIVLAPTYRENRRHATFLSLILVWIGSGQAMLMSAYATPRGGYFGSYGLFWIGAALLVFELAAYYRGRRAGSDRIRAPG